MNTLELIEYLKTPERLDELYLKQGIDLETDIDELSIYLVNELDLYSDVKLLNENETEELLIYEKDGIKYIQLFSLEHAIDLIEYDLDMKDKGYSDYQIAERLLEYRKNDA